MRRKGRHKGALPHRGDTNVSLMPPLMASFLGNVLQGSPACLGLAFSAPYHYQPLTSDSNRYHWGKQRSCKATPAKEARINAAGSPQLPHKKDSSASHPPPLGADEDEERWQGWQSRQKPSEMETSAVSTN